MAYIDINNITFNSFDSNSYKKGKKVSNTKYSGATVDDLADIAADNGGKLPTIVNALEIDWNGAELGTINDINLGTINTTGDLLNAIKALANANKYTA